MRKQTLDEFEHHLRLAKTIKQINLALEDYLNTFGIDSFAFTYYTYSPYALHKLKYDISSDKYMAWHKHFISSNYEKLDTGIDLMRQSILPSFWDVSDQIKKAKSAREKQMRKDSLAFGIEKGVSIPVHGPHEDFAILLLLQTKGQHCLENPTKIQPEFLAAAYYYFNYLQMKLMKTHPPDNVYELNSREMQCITLLSREYSIEAIAKALHISERTVNYHIQNLNKKLGTHNKYQSVIKALLKGLIKI